MIKTAVILAAGLGRRLGEQHRDKPKGFMVIENQPIVKRSIEQLIAAGMEKIIIGTGYLAEVYDGLAVNHPQVTCVRNMQYEITGSMYTLYNLRHEVSDDFLLLESDLLYENSGLRAVLEHEMPNVMLASQFTHSGDEVYIEADASRFLVNLSKDKQKLHHISAEMVGITKLTGDALQQMCGYATQLFHTNRLLDYEDVLSAITATAEIYVHQMNNLAWCEIDNVAHLERATTYIYPIVKARDMSVARVRRNVLLNPGPATTTDSVKFSQVVPDMCPREQVFGEMLDFISTALTEFVADPAEYTTVLFGGSGTAAVESILSSVVGHDAVLVVNNGAYGKRMCQIAEAYGINYVEYTSSPCDPLDLQALEDTLLTFPRKISHLAVVHNETTTGLLNDLESLGNLCGKHDIQLIVDAMSSFAAVPIDMKTMNISYLAASSNKNLQGMAGVAFVVAHAERLASTRNIPQRNFYLHLHSQHQFFTETKQMRFTPPVQTLYALKQAILETMFEGVERRYQRYSELWSALVRGITKLGLTHLVNEEHHSKIITAIVEPGLGNYDFDEMHDYFSKHGFTIYPGKREIANTFRIANIGDLTCDDIETFLTLLQRYLEGIGYFQISEPARGNLP